MFSHVSVRCNYDCLYKTGLKHASLIIKSGQWILYLLHLYGGQKQDQIKNKEIKE